MTFSFGSNKSSFSFGNTTKPSTSSFSFGNNANKSSSFSFGSSLTTKPKTETEKIKNVLTPEDYKDQLAMALTCPQMYGDERDAIIAKWNQLQAAWGTGKAYRHNNMEPIKLTSRNVFCRFKALGYSRIPGNKDKDGLVFLQVDMPSNTVRENQQKFIAELQLLFGNQMNLVIKVDNVHELPNNRSEIAIYIEEQLNMATGSAPATSDTYRVPTTVLYANLIQLEDKLKNLGIVHIRNRVAMSNDEIKKYLEQPPPGISEIQWSCARKNNPNKEKLVPVPLVSFNQLASTHDHQKLLCEQHLVKISKIKERIEKLKTISLERNQKILKFRESSTDLARKLLRLICRQEFVRQGGVCGINKDEDVLLGGLEHVNLHFKKNYRLNERITDIKLRLNLTEGNEDVSMNLMEANANTSKINLSDLNQDNGVDSLNNINYNKTIAAVLDKSTEDVLTDMLNSQQQQLDSMVEIIQADLNDFSVIKTDLLGH